MYRATGFFLGIFLQYYFGIGEGIDYFLALALLNTITLFLIILMRLCAKWSTEINKEYTQKLGQYVAKATECCGGITLIPQTTTRITTVDSWGNTVGTKQTTTCRTATWGIVQGIFFLGLSFVFVLTSFYIIYLWIICLYRIIRDAVSARVSPEPQTIQPHSNPDLSGSVGVFNT